MRRTAQKEKVGEGLVKRCVVEEVGGIVEAKWVEETTDFTGLDEFSVNGQLPNEYIGK